MGFMVTNSTGGVLGAAVFGNEHSHEHGVCRAWAPTFLLERREQLLLFTRERGNAASTGRGCPQQIQTR